MSKTKAKQKLPKNVEELSGRPDETKETQRAVHNRETYGPRRSGSGREQITTFSLDDSLYRGLIEEMKDGVFIMATDGTLLFCNGSFAAMIEKPLDQVIHSSIFRFVNWEDKARLDAIITKTKVEKESCEIGLKARGGKRVPVCLSLNSLKAGDSQAICAVVEDLREQKHLERTFQTAELANSILIQSTEAILVCDENGRIVRASQGAHRHFPGKLLFQAFDSICPLSIVSPSPLQPTRFFISAVLSGKIFPSLEVTYRREDTTESHFLLSARPLTHDKRGVMGCVVILVDITGRMQVEAELTRLASFPRLNPNPIVEVDFLGQVHYANPAAETLFPDLRKTGLEHPWLESLQKVREAPALITRSPHVREIRIGDSCYEQIIHTVFEGTRLRIYGFDITERKRAEEERERLRIEAENEKNRLEAVMEALPVGLVITDSRGGVSRFNKAYEQVWGGPPPATESVRDYGPFKAWWSATGKPVAPEEWASAQAVQEGHAVVGQLMEIEKFDGARASVINSGAPVFDAEGKILGCAVAIQDITDLRRTEKALIESNARTETILRSISDGFLTLDNDLVLTYFNQAAENLLGRKQEDVLGRNLFDAFPQARGSIFEEKYFWALKQKKPTAFETFFGVAPYENWYDVRVYPHEYGISVYFRVTTEEKKATDAIRRSKERFELLAETAGKLLATQNPQGIVNELCQKVMSHLDCQAFFNYLADENVQRLHLNAYAGIPEQTAKDIEWLDYGVAVCGCAARDASRIVCENIPVTPDPRTELVKSFGIKAYACHPLFSEGRVIGTLSFGTRSRSVFSEEELSLMKTVADEVATAMERIRLLREIEEAKKKLEKRVLERTRELRNANKKLEAERKLFYDVLETIPAYVVLLTPDYHATFANRTFIDRFGESQGRRCFEFLFERSEPCEVCETYSVFKTMAPHQWEWAGPDGRVYFVHDFPFTDVDGSTLILEMGIDITQRKRAEEELRSKEHQVRFFASECLNAQETERRRIAVELHDSIASSLAALKFRIEKTGEDMKKGLGDPESIKDLSLSLTRTIGEVRRIMADLRPSILDDLGIVPALNWLCREFQQSYSHLSVEKKFEVSEDQVPDFLKTVIFRISQEALNNIAKHSRANLVNLALQKLGERLELTIQDNGHGFQPDKVVKGFGLSTMRERAEFSGGVFLIRSSEGKGSLIRASWPLAQ